MAYAGEAPPAYGAPAPNPYGAQPHQPPAPSAPYDGAMAPMKRPPLPAAPSAYGQLAAVPMMAPGGGGPLAPAGPVVAQDVPPPPLVQVQAGEAMLVNEGKAFRRYEIIIYDGVSMQPVHSIFGTWNQASKEGNIYRCSARTQFLYFLSPVHSIIQVRIFIWLSACARVTVDADVFVHTCPRVHVHYVCVLFSLTPSSASVAVHAVAMNTGRYSELLERFGSNKGGYPRPWSKLSFPGKMFMKNVTTNEVSGRRPKYWPVEIPLSNRESARDSLGAAALLPLFMICPFTHAHKTHLSLSLPP